MLTDIIIRISNCLISSQHSWLALKWSHLNWVWYQLTGLRRSQGGCQGAVVKTEISTHRHTTQTHTGITGILRVLEIQRHALLVPLCTQQYKDQPFQSVWNTPCSIMSCDKFCYFSFCRAAASWTLFVRFDSLLLISIALFATTGGGWGRVTMGGIGGWWMCLLGLQCFSLRCAAKCRDAGLMRFVLQRMIMGK